MKNELSTILSDLRAANEALRCADLNKWSRYFKQRDEAAIRRETWADRYGGQGRGYSTSDPVVPNPLRSLHLAMDALEDAATDSTTRARVEAMLRLPAWQVAPILDDDPQAPDGGPFDIVARPRPIPLEILDSFLASSPRERDAEVPDRWRPSTWFNMIDGGLHDRIRQRNAYAKKKRLPEPMPPIFRDGQRGYDVDRVMATIAALAPKMKKRLADE
jgi:hypothetical protein